jgi:DNA end-binding protein Ku
VARAIWSGVLSFGLVAVPVRLYSATEAHEPTFHQFEQGTSDRIRYQRINERTGAEVDYSDIVRGADVGRGHYVMLSQEELDSVAPGQSRSLDVKSFVDLAEIDPLYFNKAYFLGPGNDETKKTYALLRDALADARKVAIATLVMRGKEYLAAVRAEGDLLVLETLLFADEVRNPRDEIENLPGRAGASPQELRMARQLIEAMSGPWRPAEYRDTYTDRVNKLIDAKKNNKEVTPASEAPRPTNVTSLTDALQASLDAAKTGGPRGKQRGTAGRSSRGRPASAGGSTPASKKSSSSRSRSSSRSGTSSGSPSSPRSGISSRSASTSRSGGSPRLSGRTGGTSRGSGQAAGQRGAAKKRPAR